MDKLDSQNTDHSRMTQVLLNRFGLRVHPEMGRFVLARLASSKQSTIPILGGDARTGIAVRQLLAASELRAAMDDASPPGVR